MKQVLAFVGMSGSGKGVCVAHCEAKGWKKIYFGGMVYEEVAKRGLDNVKDEAMVREDMRWQEGKEVLAKRVASRIDELFESGSEIIVLDGLYSWSEYKFLKSKYQDQLSTIAVVIDKDRRHRQAVDRDDGRRKYTYEQIAKRDFEEIENLEKGGPIAAADYYLLNNGSKQELTAALDEAIEKIISNNHAGA